MPEPPHRHSALPRVVGRRALSLRQDILQAHRPKMLLPPALVIEGLPAHQRQKPQRVHWTEVSFQDRESFGTQGIIGQLLRHPYPPVYSPWDCARGAQPAPAVLFG